MAFSLLAPMIGLRVWQMRHLARLQAMDLAVGELVKLQLATAFYGLFLPGILAVGGFRWYRLARLGGSGPATLALVTNVRLLETETTLALALVFWLAGASPWCGCVRRSVARDLRRPVRKRAVRVSRAWLPACWSGAGPIAGGQRWCGKILKLLRPPGATAAAPQALGAPCC